MKRSAWKWLVLVLLCGLLAGLTLSAQAAETKFPITDSFTPEHTGRITYSEPEGSDGYNDYSFTLNYPARITLTVTNTAPDVNYYTSYKRPYLSIYSPSKGTPSFATSDHPKPGESFTKTYALEQGTWTLRISYYYGASYDLSLTYATMPRYTGSGIYVGVGKSVKVPLKYTDGETVTWEDGYHTTNLFSVSSDGMVTGLQTTGNNSYGLYYVCDGVRTLIPVHVVEMNTTGGTLTVGKKQTLSLTGAGSVAIDWSSSNTSVATVTKKGVVKAIGAGKATITAKIDGKKMDTAVIKVAPKFEKTTVVVTKGDKITLKLVGDNGMKASWSSADTSIATVSKSGVVKGIASGKTKISCKINGETITATVKVAALKKTSVSVVPKKTVKLTVSNSSGQTLKWTTSNKKIAKVSSTGVVTGVALGTAKISVTVNGGKKLTATVKVIPAINKTSATLTKGDTVKLTITGAGSNKVTWSSSNTSIASVSSSGVVTGGSKTGTATITAKVAGYSLKCKVKVMPKLTITVNRIAEESIYNTVYVTFHNYTNKRVVYVKFNMTQYNNAGQKLRSPYSYFYLNETIEPNSDFLGHWYWVNDDTKSVKISITEVTYSDGSKWRP
ncbi:MAG: Ig-like domain-containing protein [Clostridia bacterium]|nr:Ig-like domain-containing protein [Clostridia bacterium]